MLFVRHISSASIMHSVKGDKLVLESKSLLGNILAMLKDTKIALSGIPLAFSNSDMSFRWYESFIFVGMFSVNFGQCLTF